MNIKKLAPWNWFKNEEEEAGGNIPVQRTQGQPRYTANVLDPMVQLHHEMNQFFENAFRGWGFTPLSSDLSTPLTASGQLRPQVDIGATDKEYFITVEVPGVEEKDVRVEIAGDTLTIRGEKKQEEEEKSKNYYRIERSYGSFRRELSLPADANREDIKANFKDGVLTVKIPRAPLSGSDVKQIEIKTAE